MLQCSRQLVRIAALQEITLLICSKNWWVRTVNENSACQRFCYVNDDWSIMNITLANCVGIMSKITVTHSFSLCVWHWLNNFMLSMLTSTKACNMIIWCPVYTWGDTTVPHFTLVVKYRNWDLNCFYSKSVLLTPAL